MKTPYLLLACLALAGPVFAETRYVTDELSIMLRRGQGNEFAILEQVKSGTAVEVLESDQGYVRVRTPKGVEGWVVERYLLEKPVARERIAQIEAQMAQLRLEAEAAREQLAELTARHQAVATERDALSAENAALDEELRDVSEAAADTLAIRERSEELEQQAAQLQAEIEKLKLGAVNRQSRRDFLLLGAAVLFVGVLVGLLAPHLGKRRRSDW